MHCRSLLLLVAPVLVAVTAWAADDPWVGTWKLNVEKSKTASGRLARSSTQTIEATIDGYRIVSSMQPQPIALHLDGKERSPEKQGLALQTDADLSSWRRIDARSLETTFKRAGQVVATIRREISADGRTMTTTLDGVTLKGDKLHQVSVFEKQ